MSEVEQKMSWKCTHCGYTFLAPPPPPETCPSCKEKCDFVDVSCYTPDCSGSGTDNRLG
ncbi:MAG: hypothetical protein KQJ78_18985 [Deltaproteobacteria bacterium]|nr:hypothetical protein [Deltaproteobacteria bacterium]